ncbi:MAG TPA: metal-dependent hydrolase [Tepidisphaeraceae bacterium]|nr:metal-dependent hydrolase [Tepidisphaeraceae bacterium]
MSVKVVFHGQANVEIHSGDHVIQVDPYYTGNPLCQAKAEKANPQHILLTHAHADHVGDTESIAKRTGAEIVSNYEITLRFAEKKLKTAPMNHGGRCAFPFGHAFMTIAFHTSMFDDGAYGGQPGGYIIQTGGATIYHAGDTALFGDMELLGRLFPIDLACLPIGDRFTMGPAHAMLAAKMLKAKMVLPMHYNTFPMIAQDGPAFAHELEKQHGIKGFALDAGQSLEL